MLASEALSRPDESLGQGLLRRLPPAKLRERNGDMEAGGGLESCLMKVTQELCPPDSILWSMRRLDGASAFGASDGSHRSHQIAGIGLRGVRGHMRCKSLEMQETSLTLSSSKALGWKDIGLAIITAIH